MNLIVPWLVFPLVLLAICTGCGLLLQQAAGIPRLPLTLLPCAGFAVAVVVTVTCALGPGTAALAAPALIVAAVAGFAIGARRAGVFEPWIAAAAAVVFLCYGAPVLLSGDATFAGYIKLDDSATWMAFADYVPEHGRSLAGLAPSTHEATLAVNFHGDYPIGVFLPWGIVSDLIGEDVAWTFQPYLCFLAALTALSAGELVRRVVGSPRLTAACVAIGAQPALLYGYAQWGGIKELATAALLALLAALAAIWLEGERRVRAAVPLAIAAAAVFGILGVPGAAWLFPVLAVAAVVLVAAGRPKIKMGPVAVLLGVGGAVLLAAYIAGPGFHPNAPGLTSGEVGGNLGNALNPLQVLGIWPAGDFRDAPVSLIAAGLLLAVLGPAAYVGVKRSWSAGSLGLPVYVAGALAGCALIVVVGSPWVDAKALATASPAPLLAATAGAGALIATRRVLGIAALALIAAGVLWSNILAYGETWLAPGDQFKELEQIGKSVAGQGPTLMTEFQPYAVRHFLRASDAEAPSELRRNLIPLRNGSLAPEGTSPDTDQLDLNAMLGYRTLVLRRSPVQSRPPAPYRLLSSGAYYEVWQRREDPSLIPEYHLPLGSGRSPAAVPRCGHVMQLASIAAPGERLAAVAPRRPLVMPLPSFLHPPDWTEGSGTLTPGSDGEATRRFDAGGGGVFNVWLGGSFRGKAEILIDGEPAGTARQSLNAGGQYDSFGRVTVSPGRHLIALRYTAADLHPGSAGYPLPFGPVALSPVEPTDPGILTVVPARAQRLCGRPWDWIELLPGSP